MRLEYFAPDPSSLSEVSRQGHWYAHAVEGGYDASGPTVEVTLARLCIVLEDALEYALDDVVRRDK
jgi:hypothetical protein